MTAHLDLLSPEFVRELEALRRRLDIRARSGGAGEHMARRKGGSAEFHEHRPYVAGDDMRRIDWLAYARTGEPVIKQFRAEEDTILRLLIDASASLEFGDPTKTEVARRLGAAFGYMALFGSQRAQVLVTGGSNATGAALSQIQSPRRGRGALAGLLSDIGRAEAGGSADLARAIQQAVTSARRPGMLTVVSDFFDSGAVIAALGQARAAGHDVFLVQVLTREELEPTLEGDFSLVDSETGDSVDVTMDAAALDAYMARLTGLVEELRNWARKYGACYVRAITDEPLEDAVRRFVARSVD